MSIKTLAYTKQGKPHIVSVDAYVMSRADVTPLPTRKMDNWLHQQGMRMVRGLDKQLHISFEPLEAA